MVDHNVLKLEIKCKIKVKTQYVEIKQHATKKQQGQKRNER